MAELHNQSSFSHVFHPQDQSRLLKSSIEDQTLSRLPSVSYLWFRVLLGSAWLIDGLNDILNSQHLRYQQGKGTWVCSTAFIHIYLPKLACLPGPRVRYNPNSKDPARWLRGEFHENKLSGPMMIKVVERCWFDFPVTNKRG